MAMLALAAPQEAGKPPQPAKAPAFFGPNHWDVTEARWAKGGYIYFLHNVRGAIRLKMLTNSAEWEKPKEIFDTQGVIRSLSLDAEGKTLAMLQEDVTRPADVVIFSTNMTAAGQVTFSLMGGVKPDELSTGRMVEYESFDKTKVHALFVKPKVNRLGSPPPAIVYVHGGPDSQVTLSFDPFIHVLAEAGFAVIAPNYRGSTGYGKAFEDANNKDWGEATSKTWRRRSRSSASAATSTPSASASPAAATAAT